MCIVVDVNTLPYVFNPRSDRHAEFAPISEWINKGDGVLVYGGTTYAKELKKAGRYLRVVLELKKARRAVAIADDVVDAREAVVKNLTVGTGCDDQHIIALIGVSKCRIISSVDARSYPYIQDRQLYPRGASRPKIYSSGRNVDLLVRTDPACLRNVV